jgi:cytochrome c553
VIRRWLMPILALAVVAGLGGTLVVVSGLVPIKASSGHWPITEWFLHFTMRRSIATHSLGLKAPPLDHPDLVLKGATHYEIGCRSCHGSPGITTPRIARAMTPHPPELPARIRELKAEELFYVVKHGVKFTGMPAWPALDRDDEVWAMVAFLQKLPELDQAAYHRLTHGPPPPIAPLETLGGGQRSPQAATQTCARCHGVDGLGRGSRVFPKLAGQRSEYLKGALEAYAGGERHSGIMEPIAAGLSAETIGELARHYARLDAAPSPLTSEPDALALERGKAIAHYGIPSQRVPSCVDCHAQEGKRHQAAYPALAGQPADYLMLQLELFQKGHRGGSAYAHLMHAVAPRLKSDQMRDVAVYFESLPPAP